jgi:hypothetical protein
MFPMSGRLGRYPALIAVIWLLSMPAGAIVLGQFDNFYSGTTQGWIGGSSPTNQPNGGPEGVGDRFLQLTTGGGASNLGVFNELQWAGDYAGAGVAKVIMDLKNFGPDPVSLRVMIASPGCSGQPLTCTAWTSTIATVLPPNGLWSKVQFSLAEPDLTRVLGSDSYVSSIANVQKLLLRHDDGAPSPPGTTILVNAVLGMDNVIALPEPRFSAGVLAGAALLGLLLPRGKPREMQNSSSHRVVRIFLNHSSNK